MSDEKSVVSVIGVWKIFRPDTRQYKQQSIEIEFNAKVGVEVPNVPEYVYPDTTVLTPAGMAYVQKQFEAAYPTETSNEGWSNNKPVAEKPVATDDGWSTDVTVTTETTSTKASEWGDTPTFEEAQTSVPDTEVWNPEDEAWEE